MLPFLELQYRLLEFALNDRLKWQPTMLGQLSTAVGSPGFPELVAALRQLHSKRCVLIRKFKTEWHSYDMFTGTEPDNDFFYTGGFEMSITPDGREYIEVIHESKQAEEKQIVKPAERELEQKFRILFSPAQAERDFAEWISSGPNSPVAVLFIDIDNFKKLNSAHTETTIDKTVLPGFQRFLAEFVQHRGYAYRYGGEEFLITLRNTTPAEATAFAERLRTATEDKAFPMGSQEIRLTISIGVASFPQNASTYQNIIQAANLAEHQAKDAGRNRVAEAKSDSKPTLL